MADDSCRRPRSWCRDDETVRVLGDQTTPTKSQRRMQFEHGGDVLDPMMERQPSTLVAHPRCPPTSLKRSAASSIISAEDRRGDGATTCWSSQIRTPRGGSEVDDAAQVGEAPQDARGQAHNEHALPVVAAMMRITSAPAGAPQARRRRGAPVATSHDACVTVARPPRRHFSGPPSRNGSERGELQILSLARFAPALHEQHRVESLDRMASRIRHSRPGTD